MSLTTMNSTPSAQSPSRATDRDAPYSLTASSTDRCPVASAHRCVTLLAMSFAVAIAWGCSDRSAGRAVAVGPTAVTPAAPASQAVLVGAVVVAAANDAARWGADEYELGDVRTAGDTLTLTLSYGGGCRTHAFTLVVSPPFREALPGASRRWELAASLAHEADADPCEAWLTEDYAFDLTPVRTLFRASSGQQEGTVVLLLAGEPVVYEFGA